MVIFIIIITSLILAIGSIFFLTATSQFWIPLVVFIASYVGLNILFLLYLFIIGLFVNIKKTYNKQLWLYNHATLLTMQWLLHIFKANVKTSGLEKVPHDQKYMLVYNHVSNFDPIIESWILRKDNVIHISKPENFKKPIAGRVVYRNCYIPINRDDNREAAKSIFRAIDFIKENKYCVAVSPEGTRNKGDVDKLLPFKDGCFKIALKTNCPIVICELYNTRNIAKAKMLKSTRVEMNIIDVLYYDDYKDLNTHEISEIVRNKIQNKIDERKAL